MTRRDPARPAPALATLGLVALTGAAVVLGCSQRNEVQEDPMAAADSITGTVRQVGNTPFTRVVVEGEEASLRITGDLEPEIGRLVGARVRVVGTEADGDGPGRALRATGYEIQSVDGATPRVGILRHEAGRGYQLMTEDGETVSLNGVPNGLGARVGAKVWIVVGDGGAVQRYGILREAEGSGG